MADLSEARKQAIARLAPHRFKPGQSGNPAGTPKERGSLAVALRRMGVKSAKTRSDLAKIAKKLGMDPKEARNIDVVAALVYDSITALLIRTVKGSTTAGDKLVGLLQLLLKALDGDEQRITLTEQSPTYKRVLLAIDDGINREYGGAVTHDTDGNGKPALPAPNSLAS